MAQDIIKEYLVSLGFNVDNKSYGGFTQALSGADHLVKGFVTSLATVGTAVVGFAGLVKALKQVTFDLAQADLQNEIFAHKMWTSTENAIAYKNSLSALGATVEDLYYSPELLQRFYALRNQSFSMRPPDEYSAMMKQWRDILFEFSRFKLEMTYALQWIGYYFYKYMEGPIQSLKLNLRSLNDWIVANMPHWTKQIAQVASWIARMAIAGVQAGQALYKLFNELPTKTKVAAGAFTALFTVLKMGPIGWIIAGLTALLLILDDYYTWQKGGKSLLGGFWDSLDKSGTLDKMKGSLLDLGSAISDLLGSLGSLLDAVAKLFGYNDKWKMFGDAIKASLEVSADIIKTLADGIEVISGFIDRVSGNNSTIQQVRPGEWDKIHDWLKTVPPKQPPAASNNSFTVRQENHITGTNPKEIGNALKNPNNQISNQIRYWGYGGAR